MVWHSIQEEFDKEVSDHANTKRQREQYAEDKVSAKTQELEEIWNKKLKDELEALEHELMRRQSQSRSSEIKRMKDTHLQEFTEAETLWKEKMDALHAKVQNRVIRNTFICRKFIKSISCPYIAKKYSEAMWQAVLVCPLSVYWHAFRQIGALLLLNVFTNHNIKREIF